jgi:Uri superfamily endonuclease
MIPLSRFGASDCHCEAHLLYFQEKPQGPNIYNLRVLTRI